jgi:hypothetical protein
VCVFLAKLFVSLDVAQHGPRSPRRKIPEFYVSVLAQNMARTRVQYQYLVLYWYTHFTFLHPASQKNSTYFVLDRKVFKPGTVEYAKLEGNDWHIQWLENHWKSNTHRILPGGEDAQLSYLKARRLKARRENGFDDCWKPLAILWALMDRFATICIYRHFFLA